MRIKERNKGYSFFNFKCFRTKYHIYIAVVSAITNIVGNLILVPAMGVCLKLALCLDLFTGSEGNVPKWTHYFAPTVKFHFLLYYLFLNGMSHTKIPRQKPGYKEASFIINSNVNNNSCWWLLNTWNTANALHALNLN